MSRVKAFTVFELLMALALAGIFLSLSVHFLHLSYAQTSGFRDGIGSFSGIIQLRGILVHDVRSGAEVIADGGSLKILSGRQPGVTYHFNKNSVCRVKDNKADTFEVPGCAHQFLYEGNAINKGVVDCIVFSGAPEGEVITFMIPRQVAVESMWRNRNFGY